MLFCGRLPLLSLSLCGSGCLRALEASNGQEARIVPDVGIAGCHQEPPTGRKAQVRKDLRAPLMQMLNVNGLEVVGALIQLALPRPQIPAARRALNGMPQPVVQTT